MALLPANPRDQRLVFVAILSIGLVGVYQQLVWTDKNTELNQIAFRLDTLDSLNRLAKTDVAKGSPAKMKAEADAYNRELTVLRKLVPTSNEVPPLIEAISNAARRAGLEISEVAPDGVVNGDQFDTYKYKLGVIGPYHQVAEFMSNVASMPRIVSPINVTMAAAARPGERKITRGEQLLDVKFGVQTYVAHASTRAAPAAQAKGAP